MTHLIESPTLTLALILTGMIYGSMIVETIVERMP
jgi:hypothetical protein